MQSFYGERFGYEFIEMIKDSNTVEKDKLDPDKVCVCVCVCVLGVHVWLHVCVDAGSQFIFQHLRSVDKYIDYI